MLLKKLISNLPKNKTKIKVRGLASSSKNVKKGFIFFAIKGYKINGEKYISEAIRRGAITIVCSKNCKYINKNIPIIKTSNIRNYLSKICSKFYKLKPKNIIAVTGTNGKTSVADLFYQLLSLNNISVSSIGTLGIKYKGKTLKSDLTSPDTILLHQALERIKKNKIDNVIIEASSHGLHQQRLDHLNIKAGIFTNFSQDHLDYHKSMSSYLSAKLILFKKIISKNNFIISDKDIKEFNFLKSISKKRGLKLLHIRDIKKKIEKKSNYKFNKFQIKNLAMAIQAAKLCNLNERKIFNKLDKLIDVDGRLELVKTFTNNIRVFVDFAHTPDALKEVLSELKNQYGENVSLVFGCGGDRDFKKRPLMAKVANSHCKKIYVTDDNPRNEKPENIRKQIIKFIKNTPCYNISKRSFAIKSAILNAEPNEIILVAGKGHESKQIYKNKIIHISDKEIVNKLRLNLKKLSHKKQTSRENQKILRKICKIRSFKNFHGLAIDSRIIKKNNLFLTIKGKKKDGVNFISAALNNGAKYIVSSKNIKKFKHKILKVNNEIKFLNQYALKKRKYTKAKIIAITGSAGKTSLKNLINTALQSFGNTFSSPKSYNNHLGVPLSLSHLNTSHKYGVFEVGMSKPGEINKLTKLIRPHIGIITNIGEAHIENFKNLQGIANAKSEMIDNLQEGGTLILNRDDQYFNFLEKKGKSKKLNIVTFGKTKKSDIYPLSISKKNKNKKIILKIYKQVLKLEIGDINIYNVLASIALLSELNLSLKSISQIYKDYEPTEGRGKIHKIKRYKKIFKLIDESYNANPLSVKNAINNFNAIKKEKFKKYLLLGDMLELGKKSEILHKNLSKVINNSDIDKVFIKGIKTLITYKNINKDKRGNIFQQEEDIDFTLNNIISNNDYLMIKGSNATGLNNLSKRIIKGQ